MNFLNLNFSKVKKMEIKVITQVFESANKSNTNNINMYKNKINNNNIKIVGPITFRIF